MKKQGADSTRFIFQGTDDMEMDAVGQKIDEICFKLGIYDAKVSYGNNEVCVDFEISKVSDAFRIQGLVLGMTVAEDLGITPQRIRDMTGPEGNAKTYGKDRRPLTTFGFKLGDN